VKLSARPSRRRYRDVRRDVTRDDVTEEAGRGAGRDDDVTEWRLSELWIDETDVAAGQPAAATAADDDDDNIDGGDDDTHANDCTSHRARRRGPDLVPCQSPWQRQEPNKISSDVTALRRSLASPVHQYCVPIARSPDLV